MGSTLVAELGLSARASHCLMNEDLLRVSDIWSMSDIGLLRIPNFGRLTLYEVRLATGEPGLKRTKLRRPSVQAQHTRERALVALTLRWTGMKYDDIGDAFGVSRERVRQLVCRGREIASDHPLSWLIE